MWMMGYNEQGGEINLHETSLNATSRRLRPLIPRPLPSNSNNSPNSNHPYFFSSCQHLGEQSKVRELNTTSSGTTNTPPQVVASSRWNPTPEQLRALEELYRRGTRTPSAEQIQHITAQLRRYGKIEGKNVFYWFQNHKARERQKRRRQMETTSAPPLVVDELEIFTHRDNIKELGSVFEVEQTKNWPSSNCSTTTLAEDCHVSIQRAVSENNNNNNNSNKNNKVVAGSIISAIQGSQCVRTDGWFQLGELESHNRRINNNNNNNNINNMNSFAERNATWQMQLSCPDPLLLTHLINSPTSTTNNIISTTNTNINTNNRKTMLDQTSIKSTRRSSNPQNGLIISSCNNLLNSCVISQIEDNYDICPRDHDSQTLQLFPLRSGCDFLNDKGAISGMNASTPSQFFEFLPLKN